MKGSMKALLIILCTILVIVFGLAIYNHYAGGTGKHGIDKIEELRVESKKKIEKTKEVVEDKLDLDERKKDEKKSKKEDEKGAEDKKD